MKPDLTEESDRTYPKNKAPWDIALNLRQCFVILRKLEEYTVFYFMYETILIIALV